MLSRSRRLLGGRSLFTAASSGPARRADASSELPERRGPAVGDAHDVREVVGVPPACDVAVRQPERAAAEHGGPRPRVVHHHRGHRIARPGHDGARPGQPGALEAQRAGVAAARPAGPGRRAAARSASVMDATPGPPSAASASTGRPRPGRARPGCGWNGARRATEPQRLGVDASRHASRHQRVRPQEACQCGAVELPAPQHHRGRELRYGSFGARFVPPTIRRGRASALRRRG